MVGFIAGFFVGGFIIFCVMACINVSGNDKEDDL